MFNCLTKLENYECMIINQLRPRYIFVATYVVMLEMRTQNAPAELSNIRDYEAGAKLRPRDEP
jgi:hypothetical protein